MKLPEIKLGDKEPTDSVFLKKDGMTVCIISYNLQEILSAIRKYLEGG